ncbi:MAG: SCO family protein [Flavobacteriales bacterium]|nr:SCO family protein [Flavobacteriales bacterium]
MRVLGFALAVLISTLIFSCKSEKREGLEIFGPKTVDAKGDTVYHRVGEFSFVNHLGDTVARDQYENQVYIANFFFATCPEICPKMQHQMLRVQEAYKKTNKIKLISHTVNPEKDTVEVLAQYALDLGVVDSTWNLVTGDKKEIYDLARFGYFVTTLEGDGGPTDFIHSDKFVLIDTKGRIRGYYIGLDSLEVDRLIVDIWELIKSEKRKI